MILRTDTYTIGPRTLNGLIYERINEISVENGNITITSGGKAIKQADSYYFRLPLIVRLSFADYSTLIKIYKSSSEKKYYTPVRLLAGEDTIQEIEVVFESTPTRRVVGSIIETEFTLLEVLN